MSYRWIRRRYTRTKINKYNIENFYCTNEEKDKGSSAVMYNTIVPPDYSAGVRKIANLRGSFTSTLNDFLVAIIYLPERFDPSAQTLIVPPDDTGTKNVYMPSQNVLWFGLVNGYNQTHG